MSNYPLHPNAVPLYTTVETEWLEELMNINKVTIRKEHLMLIKDSLTKARTKHPKFCDRLTQEDDADKANFYEQCIKQLNDRDSNEGKISAENILIEELAEMCTQVLNGDKQKAKEECADCIAVLVRIMEELDK